jgi:methylated-DNA-[protein]-cysteine S-methyltransferase
MNLFYDTFETNFGPFTIAVNSDGALAATAFGDLASLLTRTGKCHVIRDTSLCTLARKQVRSYLAGELREFDLPLAPQGTPFQQQVWSALQKIPYGETRSYGELAAQLGNTNASRAVGRANATNPICVIIPCHRVVGADGSLTGFAFGEEIKRRLLDLEGALVGR